MSATFIVKLYSENVASADFSKSDPNSKIF